MVQEIDHFPLNNFHETYGQEEYVGRRWLTDGDSILRVNMFADKQLVGTTRWRLLLRIVNLNF